MRAVLRQCRDYLANARGLVLLLALVLIIPGLNGLTRPADDALFSWLSWLSKEPAREPAIVLLEIADTQRPGEATRFIERLAGERPVSINFVGVPLDTRLRKSLRDRDIPVGLSPHANGQGALAFSTATRIAPADPANRPPLLAGLMREPPELDLDVTLRRTSLYVPLGSGAKRPHELVWLQGRLPIPDLVLRAYANSKQGFLPRWQNGRGLLTPANHLLTGPDGSVRVPSSFRPDIPFYNTSEFGRGESLGVFRDMTVFVGHHNLARLNDVARVLYALQEAATVYTPGWSYWMLLILTFMSVAYLFIVLPRVRITTGILLTGIAILLVLAAQAGMLLVAGQWLPYTALSLFIVISHFLMLASLRNEQRQHALLAERDAALLELGNRQIENGDYDTAVMTLSPCEPGEEVLDRLYTIGIEYERQRRYDKAFQLFGRIARHRKGFRDVAKRLQSLAEVQGQRHDAPGRFNGANTLVIPELDLELPVLGRYELRRELGRGAMGIVYLGHDPKIVRDVAVKTLDLKQFSGPEAEAIKTRFFREAEAAGRLNHPNVVTVFDIGDEKDLAFIAMDYVPGCPLSEYTKPEQLLACDTVYRLIEQAAQALDYAHRQGIVHRDIKPGNILYNEGDERIKVSDFGIARVTDTTTTRTGTVLGSPSYMAPEQLNNGEIDGRADIFSLGVTLYQLLTGELPFKGDSLAGLAFQITNRKHRPIRELRPELPVRIVRIINKALQKKPEKRFASAQEMADALARA